MKNLLVYINPSKQFDKESSILVKLQIDNSLELGWKKEDILLVTNFDYEYGGIKATVIGDDNFCPHCPQASKIHAILTIFDTVGNEIYWFHDLDAYQLESVAGVDLGGADLGLTDYGRLPRWSGGSLFFTNNSRDIFQVIKEAVYKYKTNEEFATTLVHRQVGNRIKKLNITYNLADRNIGSCYSIADKPLRVVHFHPSKKDSLTRFMTNRNRTGRYVTTERLRNLFKKYELI